NDIGWQGALNWLELGHDRTDSWPIVALGWELDHVGGWFSAGQSVKGTRVMDTILVRGGANDGELVGPLGQLGQMFANLDARNLGRDRPERATDFRGSVWLHVDCFLLCRASPGEDEDARLDPAGRHLRFGPQQLRQRQAEGSESASTQYFA